MTAADGDEARRATVEQAIGRWTRSFVDLSGNNRLLYYVPSSGSLDLTVAPDVGAAAEEPVDEATAGQLLAGRRVDLRKLFPDGERHDQASAACRAIARKARELREERGLPALYLAYGMASWREARRPTKPAAPVLMLPLSLDPTSATELDWTLELTGTVELNPALLHKLETDFSCVVTDGQIADPDEVPSDPEAALDRLRAAASRVPGFAIARSVIVGTFTYRKLAMVRDLESNTEAAVSHDLVAALALHLPAQLSLRAHAPEPSEDDVAALHPRREHIVLDADSTQSRAIEAVAAGANLIIQGPPGTGKSQTIANLIATLAADGRSVLFVAEKRAAVDAVLRRLAGVGLDSLVMDLHGRRTSRREIAASLRAVLEAPRPQAPVATDIDDLHRQLASRRRELDDHVEALHAPRGPSGMSLYDLEVGLREVPVAARTSLRVDSGVLKRTSKALLDEACQLAEELTDVARRVDPERPWAIIEMPQGAKGAEAFDRVGRLLGGGLAARRETIDELARRLALSPPSGMATAKEQVSSASRLVDMYRQFRPTIFTSGVIDVRLVNAMAHSPQEVRGYEARMAERLRSDQAWWIDHAGRVPEPPSDDLRDLIVRARVAVAELDRALTELAAAGLRIDGGQSFDDLERGLRALVDSSDDRALLAQRDAVRERLAVIGVADVVDELVRTLGQGALVAASLRGAWLAALRDLVLLEDPSVKVSGEVLAHRAAEYVELDRRHVSCNPGRVLAAVAGHWADVEQEFAKEAAFVRQTANLKRGHPTTRKLFDEAPHVLTALKPCWVTSPLEVAELLPGDEPIFDVVVFDEASQIPPADAVPAVLRGRRLVVAGDSHQLPPTTFFDVAVEEDEDEGPALGFESVLDVLQTFLTSLTLGWHYRSRDQQLIAFSNEQFYAGALTTFPGADPTSSVRLVRVPPRFDHGDGEVADAEGASAEVAKVVELALEHASAHPDRSLGIIAFGNGHARKIEEALRRQLIGAPELRVRFAARGDEPFFVKNLERVQGDERDDIILAIGYGRRNADGTIRQAFGPINQAGGERRLNVAVTRARVSMTVVSCFGADDLSAERTSSPGVRALSDYLAYAERLTAADLAVPASGEALDAYEAEVDALLSATGLQVTPKVGRDRDLIDFVLTGGSLDRPIALDTDGPRYAAMLSARDRDRLRSDHLSRLGWSPQRLWLQESEAQIAELAARAGMHASG